MEPIYGKNNKEELPLAYYRRHYREGDPREMARRCALPWDEAAGALSLTFLGGTYAVSHPDFTITGPTPLRNQEQILFLRYLLDGVFVPPSGAYLTYREFPWGEVYLQQFTGRCIKRFAFSYGFKPDLLRRVMERMEARSVPQSDQGWEITLMRGLTLRFLLWLGDDEFPPSGQILFSDNFRSAFTAEDMANIGDIVLNRMKAAQQS